MKRSEDLCGRHCRMVKEERLRWYVTRIVGEQPVRADIVD
jgi:hypothetical protein